VAQVVDGDAGDAGSVAQLLEKLEAAHRFVSPATYLAAFPGCPARWRACARSPQARPPGPPTAGSASPDRPTQPAVPARGIVVPPRRVFAGAMPRRSRSRSTHSRSVALLMPRSAAMSLYVAPGVDSYRATASALNSSRVVLHRHRRCSRFLRIKQIQYQRVHPSGRRPGHLRGCLLPRTGSLPVR
jgi:hypothetical protein